MSQNAYLSVFDQANTLATIANGTDLAEVKTNTKTTADRLTELKPIEDASKEYLSQIYVNTIPKPIPLRKSKMTQTLATDPIEPYSIGQASYSLIDRGPPTSEVGYYGVADTIAYSQYKLDIDGYPLLTEPYALSLVNNLDLPTSQVASQVATAVTNGSNAIVAAIGSGGGGGNPPNLDIPLSEFQNTFVSLISSEFATLFGILNSNMITMLEQIGNMVQSINANLVATPVSQISSDGTDKGMWVYQGHTANGLSLAELLYRGLFASPVLSDDTVAGMRTMTYGLMPYASAIVPYYAVAGAVPGTFTEDYPLGVPNPATTNSDFKNPYPVSFDPFSDYDDGALLGFEPLTTQLFLEP